eukprot:CFRG8540T1
MLGSTHAQKLKMQDEVGALVNKKQRLNQSHESEGYFVVDGDPVLFFIPPCEEKKAVRSIIEEGGGMLVPQVGEGVYHLLPASQKINAGNRHVVRVQYIYECARQKQLLDVFDYTGPEQPMKTRTHLLNPEPPTASEKSIQQSTKMDISAPVTKERADDQNLTNARSETCSETTHKRILTPLKSSDMQMSMSACQTIHCDESQQDLSIDVVMPTYSRRQLINEIRNLSTTTNSTIEDTCYALYCTSWNTRIAKKFLCGADTKETMIEVMKRYSQFFFSASDDQQILTKDGRQKLIASRSEKVVHARMAFLMYGNGQNKI